MTTTTASIISDARSTLIDDNAATYSDVQLLGFQTDAERLVVFYKPDAYPRRRFIPLVPGTNQELPADGIALMDISQNELSKRSATIVDKELLDHENRFWQAATGEVDVQHWCADPRDPRRFDITPPNDGTGSILTLYGAVTPDLTLGGNITLVDSYKYVLYAFTLHRAYAETSRKGDTVKAEYWLQKGLQALGIKSAAQVQVAPKVTANPGQ